MNKSNFSTLFSFCISISLNKFPKGNNFKGTAEIIPERKRAVDWRREESGERERRKEVTNWKREKAMFENQTM